MAIPDGFLKWRFSATSSSEPSTKEETGFSIIGLITISGEGRTFLPGIPHRMV